MTQISVSDEGYDDGWRGGDERTQGRTEGDLPAHTGYETRAEPEPNQAGFATADECPMPRVIAELLAKFGIPEEDAEEGIERALEEELQALEADFPNETRNGLDEVPQVAMKSTTYDDRSGSAQERTQGQNEGESHGVMLARQMLGLGPNDPRIEEGPGGLLIWNVPYIPNDVIGPEEWEEIRLEYQARLRRDAEMSSEPTAR